ncbi:MAG: ATP-binding cassette protein [Herbinix sp.]|jgi:ABC-2 type transport system ATP-binding protein|nr:ATP-binding cassette protein [Herbinix sp.]
MVMIDVQNLRKDFIVSKKKKGLRGAFVDLIKPEKEIFHAVDDISFQLEKGEIVGYLGPNGAGKSTTVKIMCGILQPTSGSVMINGLSPAANRKEVVSKLGVVFGQRTQLFWDLRLGESFELLKRIYRIDDNLYQTNLKLMDDVLQINEIIDKPVRQLSLGQRMRGDLVASMLHSPEILFLDEPTIGLDVEAKYSIRKFIKEINQNFGTTVILTTHDLDDVEQLCSRIIIINHGKIIEDGPLEMLIDRIAPYRYLIVDFYKLPEEINHPEIEVMKKENTRVWLRFEKNKTSAAKLISDLSLRYQIRDLSVEETKIEDVVRQVYKS